MKLVCDIQLFDQHQIVRNLETGKVLMICELPNLGNNLATICNEDDIIYLKGYEEIIQGIIKQAKEKNENIRIEVI